MIPLITYPDLPVSARREEIQAAIRDHQVVVIAGETGSGKTTQIPKMCLELGLGCSKESKGLIGHTQPRRLAARAVASRIAEELNTTLGERVGFQVRFHDQISEQTQIKVMTDGILLAETQRDRLLKKYEVIIIDEAHERSLNIDFLLGYLKNLLPKRPDLKLIITSATIDVERFSKHFNDAPIIEVSGRTFPVEVLYRPLHELEVEDDKAQDLQQGILQAVDELNAIDRSNRDGGPGDILIFLPGEREIRETADTLRKAELRDCEVIPLYARLSLAEQNRVFNEQRRAGRRIILSTNVAETSLTVPGIRYVIDPGLARISRYSYRSKVQRLPVEAISQASANQRAGRCGRVASGVCIRLYSEEDFVSRPAFTDAEIRRTNLAAVILSMLQLKLGDIAAFPFVDPPDSRFISDGFKLLEELGAVSRSRQLTQIGRDLARLPVDPRIGRMLVEANRLGALTEVLIIASALSTQDPRERPMEKRQAADEKHKLYADDDSDFITLLNLWNLYEEQRLALSQSQLRKWCQKHFISWVRMREWRDLHRQLHLSARDLKMTENKQPADYASIHRALLAGLLSHLGLKQEKGEYLGARNRRFFIFPGSGQFKKNPKWVMAAEMLETSKLFAHQVAKIEPEWIEAPAAHLIKKTWMEPHWEKKRAQVVATEQVTLYGLIIVPKRMVHYGKIDPQLSHQIFIRSALVEGEYATQAPFFKHNRDLLASVETLEAKTRRRDLLVDEETLADFYLRRFEELGGEHIVNGQGFEHWRKQIEQQQPKALFMQEEDILQRSAEHVTQQNYPDHLLHEGVKLALSYHFDPGAEDDGVTLELPLPLLNSLPLKRLEWLVPGMLADKITAILRGLPKSQRKHYVPVPNYVEAFCEAVNFAEGDLYAALAHHLLRMTGLRVDAEVFRSVQLDDYHRMNLRLIGPKKQILAMERDWGVLNKRFAKQAEHLLQTASPKQSWGRKGLTTWDFDQLPVSVKLRQAGGLEVDAYPVLLDQGDHVDLQVVSRRCEAQAQNPRGIARLYLLAMPEPVRFARKQLKKLPKSVLLAGKRFDVKRLEDELLLSAVLHLLVDKRPIDRKGFEQSLPLVKAGLHDQAVALDAWLFEQHSTLHRIQKQLHGKINLQAVPVLNDIKQQLDLLFTPHYLTETPVEWLACYPRYLQAIEIRLEKYARDLRQQCLWSDQIQIFWQAWQKKLADAQQRGEVSEELLAFRWLLEEYRVSLFAQQLGTKQTVSEKRLKQIFAALA
ncbi:ATP-dependent RNA helicase HrpA [Nitrincola schmidtii]|uniref:ATP-dependent RNA helicase HrpA n=1 Tax=Nitrincola schmidtii TaxID=1730894 RepID=UPI001F10A63B|nr:ATP-dependent RNA helicase HrpA [Nitrincola schmidtii]